MREEVKKDVLTVVYSALFLLFSIVVVLPYMVQFSTYMHERAHYTILKSYGVDAAISIDLLGTIPDFFNPKTEKLGVTRFSLDQYRQLDKVQRTKVNTAGIVSDLVVLSFAALYLALTNVYFFYKVRFTRDYDFVWILAVNWLLIMWVIALMQITIANITHEAGDVYMLVKYLAVP
ncbi:hypothetical protein A3K73_08950 [Candidatus Pacearchaeota archaeon RBG_13_36_9]|nr:MAG: hypothetical protein A3K73_08950 [Candidatus Pacearchaeota archaeon RBG_13_36_9]